MYIVLDLETTGVNPKSDAIIEFACIKIDKESLQEVERFTGFINPQFPIPDFISELTGIYDEDLVSAPTFGEVKNDLEAFIGGNTLIGHNIAFDCNFLIHHGISLAHNPRIDTFLLANFLSYSCHSLNLGYLCQHYDIEFVSQHRAIDDTLACLALFKKLLQQFRHNYTKYPEIYEYVFSRALSSGDRILYTYFLKDMKKNTQTNLEDIQNIVKKRFSQKEKKSEEKKKFSTKNHKSSYEYLSQFPKFEPRNNQKIMCDIVDNIFLNTQKICIEAPTGTGKTFAYLLPSILHAKKTGEQVCVATSTKILQDQICEEDIAYISDSGNIDLNFVKITGKKNYLSFIKFFDFLSLYEHLTSEQISFILKIYFWMHETKYGELRELDYYGEEFSYLHDIDAQYIHFHDNSHPLFAFEFYMQARKQLEFADIVITNTHVLVQDCIADNAIFGHIDHVIIDEAHSLEDVVTSACDRLFSRKIIEKIHQKIERKMQKYHIDIKEYTQSKESMSFIIQDFFFLLEQYILKQKSQNASQKRFLIKHEDLEQNFDFHDYVKLVCKNIDTYIQTLMPEPEIAKILYQEIQSLYDIIDFLQIFIETKKAKTSIIYIQINWNDEIEIHSTLLHTGEFLNTHLWSKKSSILLTSATLQFPNSESYFETMLGTKGFIKHYLESDFDYKKQACMYIPSDLGNIKNNSDQVIGFLSDFLKQVGGNAMMLCTSFQMIKETYNTLNSPLKKEDIHILAQSYAGGKNKHIQSFIQHPEKSVLIGTDSFWQGIDFPGNILKYLIVHKLPFPAPNDPVFVLRSSLFSRSFEQYAIPKTALKLKQGFGRLIRSQSDVGVCVFLDNRVIDTSWAKIFLKTFPEEMDIHILPACDIVKNFSKK